MKPILQYRELRMAVFADFIFYAQAINAEGLSNRMQIQYEERIMSNRRHSAVLCACLTELPTLYKWWLYRKGKFPEKAVRQLIRYSNTIKYEDAENIMVEIKKNLGFKSYNE